MDPIGLSTQTTFFCTIQVSGYLVHTCHVFYANPSLKWCNESTQVNFSCNPRKSLNLTNLQECVRFMRMHFLCFWYFQENSEKWIHWTKNWHTVYFLAILTVNWYFTFTYITLNILWVNSKFTIFYTKCIKISVRLGTSTHLKFHLQIYIHM